MRRISRIINDNRMNTLEPVRSATLKSRVVSAIRGAIFAGQFAPGDPLRELHLARDLNVSQPTVREALFELEKYGLVVRTPNIGTVVTNLSSDEIREQLELRLDRKSVV